MLNFNANLIAKKDYINDNNVDANNNNNDALKIKSLLISHKRKAFATRLYFDLICSLCIVVNSSQRQV